MGARQVDALVAEIGSTTTVVSAFDGLSGWPATRPRLVGQGVAATTVEAGDVGVGLAAARAALEEQTGRSTRGSRSPPLRPPAACG
ncbi:MAG: glutamate mutase L [Anaerosomatales bacterium]|nr:glutamate mutase L [Anaerosomatales bacterium]